VIHEVVGEELLEHVEVPTALHFFGIPADDSFGASDDMAVPFGF
jgi:hypothetical protein